MQFSGYGQSQTFRYVRLIVHILTGRVIHLAGRTNDNGPTLKSTFFSIVSVNTH